jgi:hypothetical protein
MITGNENTAILVFTNTAPGYPYFADAGVSD